MGLWRRGRRRQECLRSTSPHLREHCLERLATAAAEAQFRSVLEDQRAVAAEQRVHFADAVEVDDGGSMDAEELARVELLFDVLHRLAEQMRALAGVQGDVIAGGFDPVDLAGFDDDALSSRRNEEAFRRSFREKLRDA